VTAPAALGFLGSRLVTIVMAIVVLLVAGGGTFLLYQGLYGPVANRSQSASTPTPLAASPSPLAKGQLLYTSKLDGSDIDRFQVGDPAAEKMTFLSNEIQVEVFGGNGSIGGGMKYTNLAQYVTELDFAVKPGSNLTLVWVISSGDPSHGNMQVEVDAGRSSMHVAYFESVPGSNPTPKPSILLSAEYPLTGLQTGRSFTLAALVQPPHYVVYLDRARVFDVTDPRGSPLSVPAFGCYGRGGVLNILGIRIYSTAG